MKTKLYTVITCLFLTAGIWAQAPQKMSYQAVIRDAGDALIVSTPIGMQISILQGTSTGTAVYVETQTPSTNVNGLVSLEIGTGTPVTGDFTTIDWASGPYFIKTETDPAGGTSYTIEGTSELTSTPYALHAGNGQGNGTATGQIQYWDGTAWITLAPGTTGQVLINAGGFPAWGGVPAAPTVAADVMNPTTGATWMDRNLGAYQVATSSTDALASGDLYQWGRGTDGHEKRNSSTTTTIATSEVPGHGDFILSDGTSNNAWQNPIDFNLWQGVNGVNNPCPAGYRIPTQAEWDAERVSWSTNNDAGAYDSPLKLPVGGQRFFNDGLGKIDNTFAGFYWSSTAIPAYNLAFNLTFTGTIANISGAFDLAYGVSVRCIKD